MTWNHVLLGFGEAREFFIFFFHFLVNLLRQINSERPTRKLIFPHTQKNSNICWIGVWFGCNKNKETTKERMIADRDLSCQSVDRPVIKCAQFAGLWCFPVWLSNQIEGLLAVCHWWWIIQLWEKSSNVYFPDSVQLRAMIFLSHHSLALYVQCQLCRSHTPSSRCISIAYWSSKIFKKKKRFLTVWPIAVQLVTIPQLLRIKS